jgi:hypothetical protein
MPQHHHIYIGILISYCNPKSAYLPTPTCDGHVYLCISPSYTFVFALFKMVNSNVLWLEQWKVYVYGCNGWNTKVYAMYYLTMDTLSQQDKHILTPADSLHMYGKQGLDD